MKFLAVAGNIVKTVVGNIVSKVAIGSISVNQNVDAMTALGKLLYTIVSIVQYVGGAVAVFGFFELGMALFAEGQADKKPRAFMAIGAGAIMIGVKALLVGLGIIS
jgi:hypothetical protein